MLAKSISTYVHLMYLQHSLHYLTRAELKSLFFHLAHPTMCLWIH